jgi:solute carrier family 44 (choline transporter-like protein), member 2/4/5
LTVATNIWSDIIKNWLVLVLAIPTALVLSYFYLLFLRFFAPIVIWTSLLILFFALEALGGFFIWQGYTTWQENLALELSVVMPQIFFYSGIVICVIGLLYAVLVLFLIIRVRKAIGIIQEAARAIGSMPEIGSVPFLVSLVLGLYATYWVSAALYLWTNGEPNIQEFTVRYSLTIWGQILFYTHIFSFLWVSQWLFSFSTVVVSGAIGSWYWRRDKRIFDPRAYYVLHSLKRTLYFSLGTISFGSFIVAVIQMMRILFEKAYSELKKGMVENKIAKYVVWAVRIFLFVFELVIKFINKHAYVQHALYGTPFIKSAGNAFSILTRNFLQVGVLQTLTTICVWMGKILVAVVVAGCGWGISYLGWFQVGLNKGSSSSSSQSPIAIALLCFILAFLVATVFLSIVDSAIDTILQCFLVDDELCYNDPDRKPYCTKNLSKFIEEHRILSRLDKLVCQCCCCCKTCQAAKGEVDPADNMTGG